jgi:integrase
MALAKVNLASGSGLAGSPSGPEGWTVIKVCSDYIQYCKRGVANRTLSQSHHNGAVSFLNNLCTYCGALSATELKKGHVQTWLESHSTWRSSATRRSALAFVLAAFNRAEQMHGVPSPLKGLKKPRSQPRLHSFSKEDEEAIYGATEERFRDFLFAAIHTGLRPFCELARLTADDVEQSGRGMMWRVYASKTKKTRKIPVRAEVADLTCRLMKTAPRGSGITLFRNTQGNPWKGKTGVTRFLAIKSKLGWDADPVRKHFSCYTGRHTFAHRMLSGYWNKGVGCSIETLAELIGDTPKVAFDHYGKEWGQHYQDPLWAAIGTGQKSKASSTAARASSVDTSSAVSPGKKRAAKTVARRHGHKR